MSEDRGTGLDRREFLRRAAQTGVATAWAAPLLTTITAPAAYAQYKDFSYVALCYTCDGGTTRCCLKFDLTDDGTAEFPCDRNNFQTPKCDFPFDDTDNNCANCADVSLTSPDDGATIIATIARPGCRFVDGQGVGKCGNPPETGECVAAVITPDGQTAVFAMCDV
jgi:hypothetical protein